MSWEIEVSWGKGCWEEVLGETKKNGWLGERGGLKVEGILLGNL